jgi:hypothetical protein
MCILEQFDALLRSSQLSTQIVSLCRQLFQIQQRTVKEKPRTKYLYTFYLSNKQRISKGKEILRVELIFRNGIFLESFYPKVRSIQLR